MTEDMGDEGGFLNRWTARKRRLSQQANDTRGTQVPYAPDIEESELDESDINESDFNESDINGQQAAGCVEPEVEGESDEARLLTDADMPPVESLTSESDISAFFNRGVSAVLRKAALRHVFHQPVFNVRDGLNDYDGDYTVFEPLGDTITSDMKWHTARKERERLEAQAREKEKRDQEHLQEEQREALEESCVESDSQDIDDQVIDDQAIDEQIIGDQAINEQVISEQVISEQVINGQVISEQVINEQVIDEQLINEQVIIDKQVINEQLVDEQDADDQKFVRQSPVETQIARTDNTELIETDSELGKLSSDAEIKERDT